jgi:hypothetical protein
VVAAVDLEATSAALEHHLGVHDPFHDAGVGHFGLANAVFTLGDTFIEVVSPTQDDTAAGRQISRAGGDCGYMCMFELADETATRNRVAAAGARLVHDNSHPDIVDLHLHPKDVPGAIVALNITTPEGSWRWGGPAWKGTIPPHEPGGLRGLTVAVHDPAAVAALWAGLLDVPADGNRIALDGGRQDIVFVDVPPTDVERIIEVRTVAPGHTGETTIAGVRFVCQEANA